MSLFWRLFVSQTLFKLLAKLLELDLLYICMDFHSHGPKLQPVLLCDRDIKQLLKITFYFAKTV